MPKPPGDASAAPDEERLSVLTGERLCMRCGYNLTGLPVLREPHYGLMIVRCAECGTVASVQEYPLLGRWVGRWAALLAALWMLVMIAMFLASGAITFATSQQVSYNSSRPYARHLAGLQKEHFMAQQAQGVTLPQNTAWIVTQPAYEFAQLDPTWSSKQDFAAILAEGGGWGAFVDYRAVWSLIGLSIAVFIIGCVWAVAMLGRSRRTMPLMALAIVGLAAIIALLTTLGQIGIGMGWWSAIMVAQKQIGTPLLIIALAYAVIPMSLGTLAGRPIARALVTWFLPPRAQGALGMLWRCDQKTLKR